MATTEHYTELRKERVLCSQFALFQIRCSVSTVVAWIAEATETAGILTLDLLPLDLAIQRLVADLTIRHEQL